MDPGTTLPKSSVLVIVAVVAVGSTVQANAVVTSSGP